MKYRQWQPPAQLKNYIRYFWVIESDAGEPVPKTYRPIADGCPGLIFQPSETDALHDDVKQKLPGLFLYGQTVQPRTLYTKGGLLLTGVCFYPHALKSVFGLPAAELTDTCIDLGLTFNKHNKHLTEQLICTPSFDGQFDLLSSYLSKLIQINNADSDKPTHYALGQIIQANGNIELKQLLKEINMTERTFERKFNHHVGISPKLFARICRFQTSLQQLKSSNYNKLSDIAFDNGYADQSHFIRAFKEFAGYSPNQLNKQKSTGVENLLEWKND